MHPKTPKVSRECQQCGKSFLAFACHVRDGNARFCSRPCACANRSQRRASVIRALEDSRVAVIANNTGREHIFNKEDVPLLTGRCWREHAEGYLYTKIDAKEIQATHILLGPIPDGLYVDHIDRDRRNNTRDNLRLVTSTQNSYNKRRFSNNTSGFKGVHFHKAWGKWIAYITVDKRRVRLGGFPSPIEAALAYDRAAVELHGEFAATNRMLGLLPPNQGGDERSQPSTAS